MIFDLLTDTPTSSFGLILSVVLKLGIVILIIVALLSLMRYFKTGFTTSFNKHLHIIETLHLSPKQKLFLVQIGHRTMLLSATEEHIALLSEVDLHTVEPTLTSKATEDIGISLEPSHSFQWDKFWDSLKTRTRIFKPTSSAAAHQSAAEVKETLASHG